MESSSWGGNGFRRYLLLSVTKMGNYVCAAKKHVINQTVKARALDADHKDRSSGTRIGAVRFLIKQKEKLGSKLNIVRRTSLESFYLFAQIVLTKVAVIFIIVPCKL